MSIAIIFTLVFIPLMGLLGAMLTVDSGPAAVFGFSFGASLLTAIVVVYLSGNYLADRFPKEYPRPWLAAVRVAVFGLVAAAILPLSIVSSRSETAGDIRENGAFVSRTAIERFDELDLNQDGILSSDELPSKATDSDPDLRKVRIYLGTHMSDIGHRIGRGEHVIAVISRDDLPKHPENVLAKYKNW